MSIPFWDKKWGRENICPITCTRLRPGKSSDGLPYTIDLECGHRFYRKPLIRWVLQSNQSCPMCRKNITMLS
jgi:hypothetical protein